MPKLDPTVEQNITAGSLIEIDISEDPERPEIIRGIVKRRIKKDTERGWFTELETGETGYVEEIIRFVKPTTHPDIERIQNDENDTVEFKESFTFDCKRFRSTGDKAKKESLQFYIPKSICGFGNKSGGILYVGVNNEKKIVGLKNDYEILDVNSDFFVQRVKDCINNYFATTIVDDSSGRITRIENQEIWNVIDKIKILNFNRMEHGETFADSVTEDEIDILKIVVSSSDSPVICYKDCKMEEDNRIYSMPLFYVREANTTEPYSAKKFIGYWLDRRINN